MKKSNRSGAALRRAGGTAFGLYRFLLLAGLSVIILYPVLYSVSLAVRAAQDLYDPLVILIPRHFTWDNLKNALVHLEYAQAFPNSMALVLASTLLQAASCSLVGYGLARYRFRGRGVIFAMVILTIVVPPQTVIIPNYMNFRYFDPLGLVSLWNLDTGQQAAVNLINTNWAFYLPAALGMGIRSGLIIFIFRQFFRGMPRDLEEAAYIDGASYFSTMTRIIFPMAKPSIITIILFNFLSFWNEYIISMTLMSSTKAPRTLPVGLLNLMQAQQSAAQYGTMYAGLVLVMLPTLILYICVQRQLTQGMTVGGLKG